MDVYATQPNAAAGHEFDCGRVSEEPDQSVGAKLRAFFPARRLFRVISRAAGRTQIGPLALGHGSEEFGIGVRKLSAELVTCKAHEGRLVSPNSGQLFLGLCLRLGWRGRRCPGLVCRCFFERQRLVRRLLAQLGRRDVDGARRYDAYDDGEDAATMHSYFLPRSGEFSRVVACYQWQSRRLGAGG